MYHSRFFNNVKLKEHIETSIMRPIFLVGTGGGKHQSCFSSEKLGWKHTPFEPLVLFNIKTIEKCGIKIRNDENIYVEHRQIVMNKDDEMFKGHLHWQSFLAKTYTIL